MYYKIRFSERAKKQLKKLDKHISALIIGWLEKNIEGCENPRIYGKALVTNRTRWVEISYRWLSHNLWDYW